MFTGWNLIFVVDAHIGSYSLDWAIYQSWSYHVQVWQIWHNFSCYYLNTEYKTPPPRIFSRFLLGTNQQSPPSSICKHVMSRIFTLRKSSLLCNAIMSQGTMSNKATYHNTTLCHHHPPSFLPSPHSRYEPNQRWEPTGRWWRWMHRPCQNTSTLK